MSQRSDHDVLILAGAGVGGGSLNYANTLYEPAHDTFYRDPQWGAITDWKAELAPFYDQARRMLGVVTNPTVTASDEVIREVGERLGAGATFRLTPVGVFYGRDGAKEPGRACPDPYFGGAGPERRGCLECGECMTGCRHGAKNTLVKNYLHLAERLGVQIHPLTTVDRVVPRADGTGYEVHTSRTGAGPVGRRRSHRVYRADDVVIAAGTWGTQHLLHRAKAEGTLPELSDRLGVLTRTNSEALGGAVTRGPADYTRGVAITSSVHLDEHTHLEPCRYGKGFNAMGIFTTVLVDGGTGRPRWLEWLRSAARNPRDLIALVRHYHEWSERSVIGLVMQDVDNSITVSPQRRRSGRVRRALGGGVRLTSRQGHGAPNPTWIPLANKAYRQMAAVMGGFPVSTVGEVVDIPMTAHFMGGCVIGDSPETGVVDPYHRVHGHPGLHVVDGSTISANFGVNPSLTITAQAERAMSMWPNAGDPDPRPTPGSGYQPVEPVAPWRAAVPAHAPAALRLEVPTVP